MATHMVAAEVAADAALIGRYFGRSTAALSASRSAPTPTAAAMTLMSRNTRNTEGDGPGIRMLNAAGGSTTMVLGMSSAASGGAAAGSIRFMSMFGQHRAVDPIIAAEMSKYKD